EHPLRADVADDLLPALDSAHALRLADDVGLDAGIVRRLDADAAASCADLHRDGGTPFRLGRGGIAGAGRAARGLLAGRDHAGERQAPPPAADLHRTPPHPPPPPPPPPPPA